MDIRQQNRFDREAQALEDDLEEGIITKQEYRQYMRELIEDFGYEEEDEE